jgi:hypothetical protein
VKLLGDPGYRKLALIQLGIVAVTWPLMLAATVAEKIALARLARRLERKTTG